MKLKFTNPAIEISNDVAIVGSSAILKKQKAATKIDQYKDVIRFNRAPIIGWEQIAGSKTTLRIVNGHVFQNVKFLRWKEDNNFVKNLKNSRIAVAAADFQHSLISKNTHQSNTVHEIQYNNLVKYINKRFSTSFNTPTVGFLGILLMVASNITPHIYGWSKGNMSHYYNNRNPESSKYHNFENEWNVLDRLLDQNSIIMK